ncbi:MAG: hypothetical protein LBJ36_00520 [Synergistaceae bacterium]|nr:hypothetical protein [Synergistaceae bacterium]
MNKIEQWGNAFGRFPNTIQDITGQKTGQIRPVLMFFLSCCCPSMDGHGWTRMDMNGHEWTCLRCGAEYDRDINRDIKAAVNILRVGASTLKY